MRTGSPTIFSLRISDDIDFLNGIDRQNGDFVGAGVGLLAAWYGLKLCLLNRTLVTPGLEINLAWLYASSVVGGILIAVYGFAMMISPLPQGEPQH